MVEFNPLPLRIWLNEHFKDDDSFKVVGQFEGTQLILTRCTNSLPDHRPGADHQSITYLAIADVNQTNIKVLFQVEGIFDICQASLNASQTVVALVIRNKLRKDVGSSFSGNDYSFQGFVSSRFPEFQNRDLWLSITDSHSYVIQCHFIDSFQKEQSSSFPRNGEQSKDSKKKKTKKEHEEEKEEDSLIVLIHRHSIQLHRIKQIERLLHFGSSRVLALDFFWSQWIQHEQCLAFLHKRRPPSPPSSQSPHSMESGGGRRRSCDREEEEKSTVSCVQFYGNNQHCTVFSILGSEIELEPIPTLSTRGDQFSINVISHEKLNLSLILWKGGNVCLCYQLSFPSQEEKEHSSNLESSSLPSTTTTMKTKKTAASYIVLMFHHGSSIKGKMENNFNCSANSGNCCPLVFLPVDEDRLLVLSDQDGQDGCVTHILECDPSHQPFFHIETSAESRWPINMASYLTVLPLPDRGMSLLIECARRPFKGNAITLNGGQLLSNLFSSKGSTFYNRSAVLHLISTLENNHLEMAKVLKILKRDPLNLEIPSFFQQLLIGSTVAKVKRSNSNNCQSPLYHLSSMDFPATENCFLLENLKSGGGGADFSLPVDSLLLPSSWNRNKSSDSGSMAERSPGGGGGGGGDIWHQLWHHQLALHKRRTIENKNGARNEIQFSLEDCLLSEQQEDFLNEPPGTLLQEPFGGSGSSSSFPPPGGREVGAALKSTLSSRASKKNAAAAFSQLCSLCSLPKSSSSFGNLQSLPPPDVKNYSTNICLPFPVVENDFQEIQQLVEKVRTKLQNHLRSSCPFISNHILEKISNDYVLAQVEQSRFLCQLIFGAFGLVEIEKKEEGEDQFERNDYSFIEDFEVARPRSLLVLHSLLERYLLSCLRLNFPLPSGFKTCFTFISFKSTHFLKFMQHVQTKVIVLKKEMVTHLIRTLNNEPENCEKKLLLIGYLSKDEGEDILKKWDHCLANKYRTSKRARQRLTLKGLVGGVGGEGRGEGEEEMPDVQRVSERNVEHFATISWEEADYALDAIRLESSSSSSLSSTSI